jgi:hypothetical protein
MFGAFDDGPVVGAQAPGSFGIGHFTVTYLYKAPVKLVFGVPTEKGQPAGASVLQD